MKKPLYKILDIEPDASPEAVKRAYRRKAKEAHPDAGGSPETFAPVAHAYEVLSDPERRLLYDTTGQEKAPRIEDGIQAVLLGLFREALAQDSDIEVLAFVRDSLQKGGANLANQKRANEKQRDKLTVKREKIKTNGEPNVFHQLIDAELQNLAGEANRLEYQISVGESCLKALASYSEDWTPPRIVRPDYLKQYQEEFYGQFNGFNR